MQMHPSLKPSVAWVTDLTDKYRFNPFIRAAVHVILLQLALGLVSVVLFLVGIQYAQDQTIESISVGIQEAMVTGATTTPTNFETIIDGIRAQTVTLAFVGIVLLNLLFGFLIARFALWPTRNSLQFQKRFIGNIAHEIRTPLAIIKTNTEVALFDPKIPKDVRDTFEGTVTELDRISETINNLLSFDTLTRPRRMPFEPTDLGAIVELVAERHQALADSRAVRLETRVGKSRMVEGNQTALDQVVTNLVKNAINYTPADKDGVVTVTVGHDGPGKILLSVADTGIGIGQKDLFHIFEPFYRGDTSRARGIGTGTSGLGLAIVNEIVRLHKGSINIRSTPGIGTEIRITLPGAKGAGLNDPLDKNESDTTNEVSLDFSS
ncbi:MAG: two-component system, OmpR family, phosphate regulon sensor histidine kinase PhoR [Parcubacteria bacterium C7867-004]|nr:MAG: two-component system, OmpR family, phosphate regulon sensor histidine kinase PhoR [Parcubacteria bacterium C7867-004]